MWSNDAFLFICFYHHQLSSSGYTGFGSGSNMEATSPRPEPSSKATVSSTHKTKTTTSSATSKPVWTRERLKEMEKKLNGDRKARKEAVAKGKKENNLENKNLAVDMNTNFATHSARGVGQSDQEITADGEGETGRSIPDLTFSPRRQQHLQDEQEEDDKDEEKGEGEVISPRGRFLDDDEDSDIDDRSTSVQSEGDSERDGGDSTTSSEEEEIPWRQFIHLPDTASQRLKGAGRADMQQQQRQHGRLRISKNTVDNDSDMEVRIPSLDELMRSLGDFDFDFGTLDADQGGLGLGRHNVGTYGAVHLRQDGQEDLLPGEHIYDYDPRVSPKDMKAARLRNIMKNTNASALSTHAHMSMSVSPPHVHLGVSMLVDSSGEDDHSEEEEVERPQRSRQQLRRASEHSSTVKLESTSTTASSTASVGYNDAYWRDLILHGKDGHTDSLYNQDCQDCDKSASSRFRPTANSTCCVSHRKRGDSDDTSSSSCANDARHQEKQQTRLHSSFFLNKPGVRGGEGELYDEAVKSECLAGGGGNSFGSPTAAAWK